MNKNYIVAIALGSNLGNRLHFIEAAILLLEKNNILSNINKSKIHSTRALLKENSPKEWNLDYLNMVIRAETNLGPSELLKALKEIEKTLGRTSSKIWAPRVIDLDILIYSNIILKSSELIIPHKELLNRSFCLIPLTEIFPEWRYPIYGTYFNKTIKVISRNLLTSK